MASAKFTWPANESRVFIGGVELNLLQDVSGEDMYGLEKISGIGDIEGKDLVPSEATYRVNIAGYVVRDQSLILAGVWPENIDKVLQGDEYTVELFSKSPPGLLKKWEKAKVESASVNVVNHRQLMMRITMQALRTNGTMTV